jgi:hypothetical protein
MTRLPPEILGSPQPGVPLPPELKERLLAAVRQQPAPARASARRTGWLLLLGGFAWLLLCLFGGLGGIVVWQRPIGHIALVGTGWFFVALGASVLSAARGRSMLGRPRWLLVLAAGLTAPLLFLWVLAGVLPWPQTATLSCAPNITGAGCLAAALLMGLGPFVGFLLLRRGSDPLHPRLTGAALGAAAGAWGSWAIGLHCPCTGLGHSFIGHVLPAAAWALAGLLAGNLLLAVRAKPPATHR